MSPEPDTPIHDFADRAVRQSLHHPENLRNFFRSAIPRLADGFEYERANFLPNEFLLEDWRGRQADLLIEIPYRLPNGEVRVALVCVLIEHQTDADPRMPLRTLLYAVLYWDRQWKKWEEGPAPRPPFKLTPILPIVLHCSPRRWGSNRTLADMLAEPEAFHAFAPQWQPLFWELASHTSDELLNSEEAFLQALAVARVEKADQEEFRRVYREVLQRLDPLYENHRIQWYDLLRLVVGWAYWRRPPAERKEWREMAETMQTDSGRRQKVAELTRETAPDFYEAAQIHLARKMVLRLGQKRHGQPSPEAVETIETMRDLERLERMCERVHEVQSWAELLQNGLSVVGESF